MPHVENNNKYLSGIYINELVKPKETKEPHLFVIDLRNNIGIDPHGRFKIIPNFYEEIISFRKEYMDLPISLNYLGVIQNHPIEEKPYAMKYQIENGPIGKSIAVISKNRRAILDMLGLDVIGQEILGKDFLKCNVIIPRNISI